MKLIKSFSLLILVVITVASCKKDKSSAPNTNLLVGNWKLLNFHASGTGTNQTDDAGTISKAISTFDYTTINNKGVYEFTPSIVSGKGIGYDVSTTVNTKFYENNVLVDESTDPFNFTLPPTDLSTPYAIKGDSITFSNANFSNYGSMGTVTTYKYTLNGNKLTLYGRLLNTTVQDLGGGLILTAKVDVPVSVFLEKQ